MTRASRARWDPIAAWRVRRCTTRRYLAINPLTAEDLGRWWGGLGPQAARRRIESLGDEVARIDVDGQPLSLLERDVWA